MEARKGLRIFTYVIKLTKNNFKLNLNRDMKNYQNLKVLIHLSTGKEFVTETKESKNTHINSYISTFNRTRKIPQKDSIGYWVIKDYLNFNENRKPTKLMWVWK